MKKGRRGHRKQEKKGKGDDDEAVSKQTKPNSFSGITKDNLLAAATVVGIAYLALPVILGGGGAEKPKGFDNLPTFKAEDFMKSSALTLEERLMEEWPTGGLVAIESTEDGKRGLVATRDIEFGQVIANVRFPDLEREIDREHPTLRPIVEKSLKRAKETITRETTLSAGKIMSLTKFLLEESKGEDSIWHSFVESLPKNVTNMAWYWSDNEKACIVPRPNAELLHEDLRVYHMAMEEVKNNFPILAEIYTREKAEWGYLMLKTRGFGQFFLPVLHLANHDALKAVPAFLVPATGTAAYVATHNIKAGEPIYSNYGPMTPQVTSEQYGFVLPEADTTYFEVPSILQDLKQAEKTKNEPLCNQEPIRFFGNVTTQIVGAKFKNTGTSTFFKAFMPDERSYACIRVLLQTERDTDVARYISEKLEVDLERYRAMVNAPHCQSSEGNLPLIHQANLVTVKLMEGALKEAEDGRDWIRPYPDIPTYIMNENE